MFNKELLINLIERSGMSLTSIGKEIGVNHSTLSLLVRGLSNNPQPATVNALAKYFGLSPAELFIETNTDESFTQEKSISLNSLGATLKYLMQRSGIINSSQLQRYTEIAIPTIDRILNGETESPNANTLTKLAQFFDVTIAQLKGLDPIPEGKLFYTIKSSKNVPLIDINNIVEWNKTHKQEFIIKYIKSELLTISEHTYAIQYKPNFKLHITYIIDPDISPEAGDIIVVSDGENIHILEYYDNSLCMTLDYKEFPLLSAHNILGVAVQELRERSGNSKNQF